MTRRPAVIVDMDGTLCDVSTVLHLQAKPDGFAAFHQACAQCPPHRPVVDWCRARNERKYQARTRKSAFATAPGKALVIRPLDLDSVAEAAHTGHRQFQTATTQIRFTCLLEPFTGGVSRRQWHAVDNVADWVPGRAPFTHRSPSPLPHKSRTSAVVPPPCSAFDANDWLGPRPLPKRYPRLR